MPRQQPGPTRDEVRLQNSRRRFEEALEEVREGLHNELGWKIVSKAPLLLLAAVAAGVVAAKGIGRLRGGSAPEPKAPPKS